ncbi:MAG: response regulator, partial [Spirochaetales bacterium]|nr:response regulator [Spirochaetales bacterium]
MPSKRVMLIVDNIDEKSKYLEAIFKDDFTIFCAFSDAEAISIIEKEKLSIIMLNVLRPNLNGYVVLDYLKNSVYADLPVVSICSDETEQVKLLKYGVDEFIVKGINPDIIRIRVDHILTRHNLQNERKLVEELKRYNNLVNESSNAVYVVDYNTYEILHMNTTMLRLINKEGEDFHNKKCYEFLTRGTSPCKDCNCKNLNYQTYTSINFKNTLTNNSYCVRGKYIDWDGHFAHVEYIQDVTDTVNANEENIKLKMQAETALEQYQTVVNTVPG